MSADNRRSKDVDRLVSEFDAATRETVEALRSFLLETGPELQETVKWGAPCYVARGNVCSIAVHRDHMNLEFYRGATLRDPKGLLEGTGKMLRHAKLRSMDDVKGTRLGPLLREAIALDAR